MNFYYYLILILLFTYLMSILGIGMVLFIKKGHAVLNLIIQGLGTGIMLGVCLFSMFMRAISQSLIISLIGFIVGCLFIILLDILIHKFMTKHQLALSFFQFVIIFSIHNILEGMVLGTNVLNSNFASSISLTFGIGLQNILEASTITLLILTYGFSKKRSFCYSLLISLIEPLAAVFSFLLLKNTTFFLSFILSLSAGMLIYIVISDLILSLLKTKYRLCLYIFIIVGLVLMAILELLI